MALDPRNGEKRKRMGMGLIEGREREGTEGKGRSHAFSLARLQSVPFTEKLQQAQSPLSITHTSVGKT
jgi:hypothetical protein